MRVWKWITWCARARAVMLRRVFKMEVSMLVCAGECGNDSITWTVSIPHAAPQNWSIRKPVWFESFFGNQIATYCFLRGFNFISSLGSLIEI